MRPLIPDIKVLLAFTFIGAPSAARAAEDPLEIALASSAAYSAAFEKRDASAVAALYSEDAQYVTDSGETISGRAAIQERSKAFLSANPDARIAISVDSVRFLTPDVLVEKGYAIITGAGEPETTRYTATHIRQKGGWIIAELDETILPPADPGTEALSSLDWIIGSWKSETKGVAAETEANWSLDGRFITRTTKEPRGGEDPFVTVEVIGYDPIKGRIRSWFFDAEGGFGEGTWRQDGDKWLLVTRATLPSGGQASSEVVITVMEEGRIGIESINRVLDGELLPNWDRIIAVRTSKESKASSDE